MQKRLLFVASLLLAICNTMLAAAQLTIGDVSMYPGVEKTVSVELTNDTAYVGFQFDLYLPDGITVEDFAGSDRLPSGTTPQMAAQPDGSYRFIAAALSGNAIPGNSGAVMTITLTASQTTAAGDYVGYMRNVKVSKADGSGVVVAEQPFAITVKDAEAYAVLNGTTLTFYYDKQVEERGGMILQTFTSDAQRPWHSAAASIQTVTFDTSFAAYLPTATARWFSGCTALTTLNGLDNLNTSEVTYMDGMFTNCSSLKTLYISNNWDLSKMTSSISMFYNCTSLVGGQWTAYASSMTTATYARIDGGSAAPGYFTSLADNAEVAPVTYSRSGHTVTLSSATANTHIMYKLSSDTEPQWKQYSEPLTLTGDCVITAYAERPSGLRSAETEYNFVLNANFVEAPSIYRVPNQNAVVITNGSGTGTVYYNFDENGMLTTTNAQPYTAPIAVTQNVRINAAVVIDGIVSSDITSFQVDWFKVATPTYTWDADTLIATTTTEGAVIEYKVMTTASETPADQGDEASPLRFSVTQDATIILFATKSGMNNSDTVTIDYPYTEWSTLLTRIANAHDAVTAGTNNDNVPQTMVADLQVKIQEANVMYANRTAQSNAIHATADELLDLTNAIMALVNAEDEPYAVLDETTLTFYYDKKKQERGGMNIGDYEDTYQNFQQVGREWDASAQEITTVVFDPSFANNTSLTSTAYWFCYFGHLTTIIGLEYLNTSNVINMRCMFAGCASLKSLDISTLNTQSVVDMYGMFGECPALENVNLSGFNTSKVENMNWLFGNDSSLKTLDLSGFNTANVTNMNGMFYGCSGLTSLDVSGFKTDNVTNMSSMFDGCSGLTTIYVGEEWSTANVTESSGMFTGCTALVGGMGTVYDANHVDAAYAHIDGGTANPGYLTSVDAPSSYAVTLKAVGNGTVKAADITVASGGEQDIAVAPGASLTLAFTPDAGYRLENVTVDDTDVTSQLTVDSTGVSYYTLMSVYAAHTVTATFVNDTKEAYAVLSADGLTVTFYYDTQKTARGGMDINSGYVDASPYGSATTAVIDASFADYYPTSTAFWFCSCSNLTSIDGMVNLKTANVTDMSYMFYGCSGLTSLDLSGFNTANVTDMEFMFLGCSALTTIYVGEGWNTEKVTESTEMFTGCTALVGGAWTAYDNSYVEADYAHIDGGTANPGYLTSAADATVPAVVTYSRAGHTVTLSSATANVHIMYTLSTWVFADNEPQWEQYTDPLALTEDCTITAYAVRPSGLRSADTEYNFVLNANFVEAPTIARDGEENRVVITNNSTTGTVYYNYDANGQLTATNSSQYVGPIDVSQNVRINAAVIIDGVVSSDITSFTVDWFKVATPTYTWDADKLTASTTTAGAVIEVQLTLLGDSTVSMSFGDVQTVSDTIQADVHIDIYAVKDGWTDADVVSFDYPYTAWMQLMQAVDQGHQTMAAAAQSDKVDTVSPNAPYATLNKLIDDADLLYYERTADRSVIENLTDQISETITLLQNEMNAEDEFSFDANGVLHVFGNGLLEDALAAAGGREEVAKTLTAILWDKQQTLTDDMLQGLTDNPNLLIYVPGIEQAPVTVHNVVVGEQAQDILLVDGETGNTDFYCPRTFTADKISYTRNFTQKTQVGVTRGWESIVLPFTVQTITHESHGLLAPFGTDASTQHFWLRQLSPDGLERATEIVAYRPYLISMPNDSANYSAASCHAGRVTFTATDVDVMAATPQPAVLADETRRLIGTTKRVAAADDIYVLNVGQPDSTYLEGSVFVRNLRGVRPFECFTLHVGDGSRYISFDELSDKSTLGIAGTMYDGMKQEQWFTIDGRKLQRRPATKGVYILNGRKVVVK